MHQYSNSQFQLNSEHNIEQKFYVRLYWIYNFVLLRFIISSPSKSSACLHKSNTRLTARLWTWRDACSPAAAGSNEALTDRVLPLGLAAENWLLCGGRKKERTGALQSPSSLSLSPACGRYAHCTGGKPFLLDVSVKTQVNCRCYQHRLKRVQMNCSEIISFWKLSLFNGVLKCSWAISRVRFEFNLTWTRPIARMFLHRGSLKSCVLARDPKGQISVFGITKIVCFTMLII